MGAYVPVFGVAFLTTLVVTSVVRRLAHRFRLELSPSERGVHQRPTPNVGGFAMLAGLLAALAAAWRLDEFAPVFESSTAPQGVAIAAVVIFVVGVIDDVRRCARCRPRPRSPAWCWPAASCRSPASATLFFRIPFLGLFSLSPDLSALVTVLWVVGMANAVNLIDGLDGLAAGITAIAAGAFFLYGAAPRRRRRDRRRATSAR